MKEWLRQLQGNVEPVLSQIAQGYTRGDVIGTGIMPIIEVPDLIVQVPTYNKDHFRYYETERALRANSNLMSPEAITFAEKVLKPHDIAYPIDKIEKMTMLETSKRAEIKIANRYANATQVVKGIIDIGMEAAIGALVATAGSYDATNKSALTGNNCWDPTVSAHADSNPDVDIETGKTAIYTDIGVMPNVCAMGITTWQTLKIHPHISGIIFGEGKSGVVTPEAFKQAFGFEVLLIGSAKYNVGGVSGTDTAIWGDMFWMGYVPQAPKAQQSMDQHSFGYTLRYMGMPAIDTFMSVDGNVENIRCTDIYLPVVLDYNAGYLITNTVT